MRTIDHYKQRFMAETALDQETADAIFEVFIEQAQGIRDEIDVAFKGNQTQVWRALVHQLKGSAANLRIESVQHAAEALESAADNENFAYASQIIHDLFDLF